MMPTLSGVRCRYCGKFLPEAHPSPFCDDRCREAREDRNDADRGRFDTRRAVAESRKMMRDFTGKGPLR